MGKAPENAGRPSPGVGAALWRGLLAARTRERLGEQFNRVRALFLARPYSTVLPHTTVGLRRLRNLDMLAHRIDELGVEGDIVECGTYNGGSGAILARIAVGSPLRRHVFLLDSFEGLPPSSDADGPAAREYTGTFCGSEERVRAVLRAVDVPYDRCTVVKGWFADTVPNLDVNKIALLHIDADWYQSVRLVLEHLYDKVQCGGYVVLDDYGYWEGCRRALHDVMAARSASVTLTDVDGTGAFFQKPS